MMNAIAISRYGTRTRQEMELKQLPLPAIGPKDVLIEVHATAINPVILVFGSTTGGMDWEELQAEDYFVETEMVGRKDLEKLSTFIQKKNYIPF